MCAAPTALVILFALRTQCLRTGLTCGAPLALGKRLRMRLRESRHEFTCGV